MKKETTENKNSGRKKKNPVHIENKWNWRLLPLQFVVALLPMVIYHFPKYSGYSVYSWNSIVDEYHDVFLHAKVIAFGITTAVVLILAALKLWKMNSEERKKSCKVFIPLFLYLGLVILSTICSTDLELSLYGAMEAQEPFFTLLGYVVVAFYAYLVLDSLEDVKYIVGAAVVGACLMASLGIMQTIGKDPLLTEGVQRLYVSSDFLKNYGMLTLATGERVAYGTLFNPNYVGTYVALYIPLLLVGFLIFKELWKKLICVTAFVGLLVMLFSSQSRTGLIAVFAVAVMLLVFLGREVWKRWYLVIPGVTFLVMAFLLIDTYRDNLLTNRLKEMFAIEKSETLVKGVDTTGNGVRVLYADTEFTVMMPISGDAYAYIVMENGEQREVTYDETGIYAYFTLSTGDEITIQTAVYEDEYAFGLNLDGRDYYFTNQIVVGNYKYINDYGRPDECTIPKNALQGYEKVASGRGYVWGRTIPLLWKNFIVGSGPDTFAIEFPQNDYVARYKSGFNNIIFTRPHNFYLQTGVQTGTLSLLALLVFYLIYFVGSCRRYMGRKFTKMEEWFGFAMFLSSVGFFASGFANDSLIVVTPVFYVLLGAGMAINHRFCPIEKKEKRMIEEGTEN